MPFSWSVCGPSCHFAKKTPAVLVNPPLAKSPPGSVDLARVESRNARHGGITARAHGRNRNRIAEPVHQTPAPRRAAHRGKHVKSDPARHLHGAIPIEVRASGMRFRVIARHRPQPRSSATMMTILGFFAAPTVGRALAKGKQRKKTNKKRWKQKNASHNFSIVPHRNILRRKHSSINATDCGEGDPRRLLPYCSALRAGKADSVKRPLRYCFVGF